MANENLGAAKKAKQDEFYTQFADIQNEMNAYLDYNPDVFRGKTILLPCDDPEWSNFTRYFAQNFEFLGLRKLISTSYAPNSKTIDVGYQPPLFEIESEKFDEEKTRSNGKIFTLTDDITGDQKINVEDLEWSYLQGNGDFRSQEVTNLRDEADFIITNPPFSLFREFMAWIVEGECQFSVIGSKNSITYKEIFPLIKNDRLWLGYGFHAGNAYFSSPFSRDWAAGVYDEKTELLKFRNLNWFTNIEHGKRRQELPLMTMAENIKFSKHKELRDVGYQTYDNYDAIEVPYTVAIPSDYEGVMGVPISFLDKYNPDQFKLLGFSSNEGIDAALLRPGQAKYDRPYLHGKRMYVRLFIQAAGPQAQKTS